MKSEDANLLLQLGQTVLDRTRATLGELPNGLCLTMAGVALRPATDDDGLDDDDDDVTWLLVVEAVLVDADEKIHGTSTLRSHLCLPPDTTWPRALASCRIAAANSGLGVPA